jgi:hypothetical protein
MQLCSHHSSFKMFILSAILPPTHWKKLSLFVSFSGFHFEHGSVTTDPYEKLIKMWYRKHEKKAQEKFSQQKWELYSGEQTNPFDEITIKIIPTIWRNFMFFQGEIRQLFRIRILKVPFYDIFLIPFAYK